MSRFDAIIIGAGHNGLVTAAYLARNGRGVLVLERRDVIGGACVTEEVFEGFKVSTVAYVNSLFRQEIVSDLRLADHGFEVLAREPASFTPFPDGRYLLMGPDEQMTRRQIAKFSQRDADAYPRYQAALGRVCDFIEPLLMTTPPNPPVGRIGQLCKLAGLAMRARKHGDALFDLLHLLTGSAAAFLDRWFESDELKATLTTDSVIGAMASPTMPGTAYVLLHHVMGQTHGHRGVWGYVRGGMGALTQALAAVCRQMGVQIRCDAAVEQILVEDRRAVGVRLANGEEFRAAAVVSNADCHVTFRRLLDPSALPEGFLRRVSQIDYSSASVKINTVLGELPDFSALPGSDPGPQHRGTIHICPSMEYIERAFDDAKYGTPSQRPVLECTIPSVVDPTVAPPGKHLMSIFVQYAPYHLRAAHWDEIKEEFADRCLDVLAEYAPNIKSAVLERQVLSPLDLEREFSLTGGNIFQGTMIPSQLFFMRPVPGYADYRTPIKGLYLCGAATHPGGGVMGACGYNAAREILKDL